ncbi:hypothetical protein [Streptomyces indicus]|uniref:Proteins of 100 residues with WXG n=1 Tax=Streptomyces indicus TaxID=417292 RepID=A0A1G8UD23_9ACTN|nr:hypothetical protein [Streptomyces indicus]SDJ51075.1 hypothetical protein SAMN05421806_101749 [Streptomyces indicus]
MAESEYPNLGFDPVPGNPAEISALQKQVAKAAKALGTSHELVDRLQRSSTSWKGEGGDAFRRALTQDLPQRLRSAHESLSKASSALLRWHDGVVARRTTARDYESRAARATSALTAAASHATEDPEGLERARDAVADVLRLARELEGVHLEGAREVGRALEGAGEGAPEEPGVLDEIVEFIDEDLGDYLALGASLAGLAAVVATTPVGVAIALTIASTASIGALGLHARDPKTTGAIKRGFTEGKFDAEFWNSTVTLAGDALGALPIVGTAAHGAKGAAAAMRAASAADDAGMAVARAGVTGFKDSAKAGGLEIARVKNPLSEWALHGVSPRTKEAVEVGVSATGVATGAANVTDAKDNETYAATATAVDAARIASDDAPSNLARISRAFSTL